MPDGAATAHLLRPKLGVALREGYGLPELKADALAGLTVAVVALPLSMAIAVASGVGPERGLATAIIGGFLVSALGGSRYQIGGPAGAFIVLVAATVARFGLEGLLLTVLMSGAMLTLLGVFRLGALIRHIPHAVTVGFTAAIAVTILASQLKDLAGLTLAGPEPGELFPKLAALAAAAGTVEPFALATGVGVAALILILRKARPAWPGMLIALVIASVVPLLVPGISLETIGSRFGEIPHGLSPPRPPHVTWALALQVLPAALSFTLLGAVESLLSAKVADSMTGRVHRSSMELIAQGIANMASALFGGISVTGTIARTATNIRAGAKSPLSGVFHALFLLAFVMLAAPLAAFIPLSALAGVLVVVAWNMTEKDEIAVIIRERGAGAVALAATFIVTLAHDLTAGIVAGCLVAALAGLLRRGAAPRS